MMRRVLLAVPALLALLGSCGKGSQRPDDDFDTRIAQPLFKANGPVVLFDEGHRNFHKAKGTYRPFVALLKNDGYRVSVNHKRFDLNRLGTANVLVVVNAEGANESGDSSAFTMDEIGAVRKWVADGGSLLLVVDHFPFATAASRLTTALGTKVAPGMTMDTLNYDRSTRDESQLVFSNENGLLGPHPITTGFAKRQVRKVVTFTGTSIEGPPGGTQLLRLGPQAFDMLPRARIERDGGDTRVVVSYDSTASAAGRAQAVVFPLEKGRVAIVADAGSLTAQIDPRDGHPFGMNAGESDNRNFMPNLMAWLARYEGSS